MTKTTLKKTPFAFPNWSFYSILILIFMLGLGMRFFDLTDLPLDFHPTRQLYSALKARGIYYQFTPDIPDWQRERAYQQWRGQGNLEPPVLNYLVAYTYRLTNRADLWIARIYSSVFWVLGGLAIFALGRNLTSRGGGLLAAAFYLFLPYGAIASRSFQPDPLMVALIAAFLWALERWINHQTIGFALIAGLFGGFAIFIKITAFFFVMGGFLAITIGVWGFRTALREYQTWLLGILIITPMTAYYIYGNIEGSYNPQFVGWFIPSLFLKLNFYLGWEAKIAQVVGVVPFALGLLGIFLFEKRASRALAIGLWSGYLVYAFAFNYHNYTHDYYQLPLIPVVAFSLAPFADILTARFAALWHDLRPIRMVALFLLAGILLVSAWDVRRTLRRVDYRPQADFWAQLGEQLGHDSFIVGLTQDYGYRANYWGWMRITNWPALGDLAYYALYGGGTPTFSETFQSLTAGQEYFLVTDFDEFKRQTDLQDYLFNNYPIVEQADDVLIFDLIP